MPLGHLPSENLFLCMVVFSPFFQTSKDDLLLTDFEGALKFFRVQLPKRYRSEENAKKTNGISLQHEDQSEEVEKV